MRSLISLIALFALAAPAVAPAATAPDTLTLKTGLGPLEESAPADGSSEPQRSRELRARGVAPKGSRLKAQFFRGKVKLGTTRPKMTRHRRYRTNLVITRTGTYRIRVVARTPSGETIRVSALLRYIPKATAPSAPNDTAP